MGGRLRASCAIAALLVTGGLARPAAAETLTDAFAQAYQYNPQLLAQRAQLRATDEGVPQALAGWRPTVQFTGSAGKEIAETTQSVNGSGPTTAQYLTPRTLDLNITEPVWTSGRTPALIRQAEHTVLSQRAQTVAIEEQVLFSVAQAYLDVVRDQATVDLNVNNEQVLRRQLEATNDQFRVGEVTRTDVAQAESSLAAGRAQLAAAESNYLTSRANFRQVIGVEPPARLAPGSTVDRFFPLTLDASIARSRTENPTITTAMYNVDVALLQVKVAEGALYPTLQAVGNVQKNFGASPNSLAVLESLSGTLAAQLTVPLYQGGAEYSTIRQAKETLGQRRLDLDTARDQVQAAVVQGWGLNESAKAQILATQAQVTSAEVALNGVREEARVGQRTTLDVLNAQQTLVNARVALVTAQHDRVVASYTVLSTVGSLSPQVLGLRTEVYDAMAHYQQVRNAWGGVRIPDGR